ncbi:MAG: hypothetical protein JSU73_02525 [candidate division WOR-3 bacterium]|nr:MAG: hypothetical protein JSU73_02525 [candidate division WOR-3 bacterium]
MRAALYVLLALPVLLVAVPLTPMTVLPDETPVDASQPFERGPGKIAPDDGGFVIGVVDTIGGTTYDWLANGAALRQLVNAPDFGIHALWMYSTSMSGTSFPDRNMRYNFYDYSAGWNWIDPDHMQSGVNAFVERVGFGNLSMNPDDQAAVPSCHHAVGAQDLAPIVARDAAPGTGIFEYCEGEPTLVPYAWNRVAVGQNGTYHLSMMLYDPQGNSSDHYYSRATTWCNWDNPVAVPPPQPHPDFPDHNIAVSRVQGSNKVCLTWVYSPDGYSQKPGFYRISTDGGTNWGDPTQLLWPTAYGGDTLTSFHITSLFPFYDLNDELHFAACVAPFVRDTNWILPAEIWHWSETDGWSEIFRGCDSVLANIGYNAITACRPSMGTDSAGNLFVAWENFDGLNYESLPVARLRADIWYSYSVNNGQTWAQAVKITDGGSVSHRFPCIMDYMTDTVAVLYLIDQHAGFVLYNEGPHTNNPIVVQRWKNPASGVKQKPAPRPVRMEATVVPNPFGKATRISYAVPNSGDMSLAIYDPTGRPVRSLVSGHAEPGRYFAVWDGRADNGDKVAAGVYLYRFIHRDKQVTGKLTLTE